LLRRDGFTCRRAESDHRSNGRTSPAARCASTAEERRLAVVAVVVVAAHGGGGDRGDRGAWRRY
jgi:hypothetical protein